MDNSGFWIFYCNPKFWEVDEFLDLGLTNSTWTITEWQKDLFRIGDKGVIRVGEDKRTKAQLNGKQRLESGIYAIVEITSTADQIPHLNGKHWLTPDKPDEKRLRVKIKVIKNLLDSPILIKDLKKLEATKIDEALIRGRRTASWTLSKTAFENIEELTSLKLIDIENIKNENYTSLNDLKALELKYSNATPRVKEIISKKIERGKISRIVKKINNYECQVCKALGINPHVFIKQNGEFYIETHHIIPVSELEQGSLGILNLITICPNHHRQMHYGKVKLLENTKSFFRFEIDNNKMEINKTIITSNSFQPEP